ncbi:MAG: zf-TFIIB domain-containing protein [Xanthomonadales bacterium]|nr:zf-TFIIB domain-containing protein [Xanthomonadales bacterium]
MQCPKCLAEMTAVYFGGVEVDRCTECHGIWFDHLEHEQLRALTGSVVIDSGAVEIGRINNHLTRISCPVCHCMLTHSTLAGPTPITVERCDRCHGVYFDAGEFSRFAASKAD